MTESMIIEAVRSAGGVNAVQPVATMATAPTADPDAIARFQAAMAPEAPQGMPIVSELTSTWQASQDAYQTRLHRIETLTGMLGGGHSAQEMMTLQYEVAALAFQQEVVTNVAKKASDAVSTLVKNG